MKSIVPSLVALCVCANSLLFPSAGRADVPELAIDAPDVVFGAASPLIQDQADALGNDPVRIYEFVLNEFRYQPYFGLLKGPTGALVSRGGNDYDLAALLVSLLRASGFEARFVRGRIAVPEAQAMDWVGASTLRGTQPVLQHATPFQWRTGSNDLTPIPGLGVERVGPSNDGTLVLTHVWVEARLPLGRYRGSGPDPLARGLAWIALDPSFKLADWPDEPGLPIGTDPTLTMDYHGEEGYLSDIQEVPPASFFRDMLRDYLAANRPGTSVADVLFTPTIRTQRPGVLPTALPYSVEASPAPVRSASLEALHTCVQNAGGTDCTVGSALYPSLPASGHAGAGDYRYPITYRLCELPADSSTPDADAAACNAGTSFGLVEHTASTAALVLQRASLVFPPSSETEKAKIPAAGLDDCSGLDGDPIRLRPTLFADGARIAAATETVDFCDELYFVILADFPLFGVAPVPSPHILVAGGTFVVSVDGFTGSELRTRLATDALVDAQNRFPVAEDATGPFVDIDGDGALDPSEDYLSRDFAAREARIGGLLELASARYWEIAREGQALSNRIHHALDVQGLSIGLISSDIDVDYLFDAPFAVRASKLLVDIKGGLTTLIDRRGRLVRPGSHALTLNGMELSASEHRVWQEVAQVDAVSTVRGLQLVAGLSGSKILRLDTREKYVEALGSCLSTDNAQSGFASIQFPVGDPVPVPIPLPVPQPDATRGGICIPWEEQQAIFEEMDLVPQLADSPGSFACTPGCGDIDGHTYCELRRGFGLGTDDTPGIPVIEFEGGRINGVRIPGEVCDGVRAMGASELIIAERSAFRYDSFEGFVYYRRFGSTRESYAISDSLGGTAGGGHAIDTVFPFFDRQGGVFPVDLSIFNPDPINLVPPEQSAFIERNFEQHLVPGRRLTPTSVAFRDFFGDPVGVVSGNYFTVETDLEIRGRGGLDFRLVRSYNSRLAYDGPLGYGWTHTYDQHLRPDPVDADDTEDDRLIWVDESGRETPFDDPGLLGELPAPPFSYARLERLAIDPAEPASARYLLTTKAGIELRFGPEGGSENLARLLSITDRNGNRIRLEYDVETGRLSEVLDSAGRPIAFEYDPAGRLARVEDVSGRAVEYSVDQRGDLVGFKAADQVALGSEGKAWTFDYYHDQPDELLDHNLRRFEKPERGVSMEFFYYDNDTVSRHVDGKGRETRFLYNYIQRASTITFPDGTQEVYRFDRDGNVVNHVDARGVSRNFEFDERRNKIAETDGLGFRTSAAYDLFGNLLRRVDRLGNVELFEFNRFGQLRAHTDFHDPNDSDTKPGRQLLTYDARGNLEKMFVTLDGKLELAQSLGYDDFGNVIESIQHLDVDGNTATTRFFFDETGTAPLRNVDPLGNETRFVLDALGRPRTTWTMRQVPDKDFEERVALDVEYDPLGRVTAATDGTGVRTETRYDANGLVTEVRTIAAPAPDGTAGAERIDVRNFYDNADQLIQAQNALGDVVTMAYDALDRVVAITSPLGNTDRFEHDAVGNVIRTLDPTGAASRTVYDAEGRVTNEIDPLAGELRTEYDAEGRVIRMWEEFDRATQVARSFTSAPDQRLVFEAQRYDPRGNLLAASDGEGRAVEITYDELNRSTRIRAPVDSPDEGESRFEYDLAGRLRALTERVSTSPLEERTSSLRYDALGRVLTVTDALNRVHRRTYDSVGNVIESESADGLVLRLTYDRANRLTRRTGPGVDDRFAYDGLGRRVVATNSVTGRRTQYDELDRPVSVFDASFGAMRLTYDPEGNITSVVYPNGSLGVDSGTRTQYAYDPRGLLSRVTDSQAGSWTFEYDVLGRLVRRLHTSGEQRSLEYSGDGFLSRIEISNGADLLGRFVYDDYDALGNPGMIRSEAPGLPPETTRIVYDDRSRVTEVRYNADDAANQRLDRFTYDQVGNRRRHVRDGVPRDYLVDRADQLEAIAVQGEIVERFSHDPRGRRTVHEIVAGPTVEYSYDVLSRLTRVARSDGYTAEFLYDPDGDRFRRSDVASPPAHYFGEIIEHRSGSPLRVFSAGPDDVLAEVGSDGVRRPIRDGSANFAAVDGGESSAALASEVRYTAFGVVRSETAPTPLERGFAGRPREGDSGLLNVRARHYDPATGRFLQPDPLGLAADQTYAYGANNPFVFGDPSGLSPLRLSDSSLFGTRAGRPTRALGALQAAAGALSLAFGIAACSTGAGCFASAGLIAFGLDNLATGAQSAITNMETDLFASRVLQATGVSRRTANFLADAADFASGGGIRQALNVGRRAGGSGVRLLGGRGAGATLGGSSARRAASFCGCFAGDTEVWTARGLVPIAEVEVGDRVETHATLAERELAAVSATAIDEGWRTVELVMVDGSNVGGTVELTAVRPAEWLTEVGAEVGGFVPIEAPELGLRGLARVRGIRGPPEIQPGAGRVVLTTISRDHGELLSLSLQDVDAPLEVTSNHRLYSEDRGEWVEARDLRAGEKLQSPGGSVRLETIRSLQGRRRVFNLEVDAEHEYYVSSVGVRAHNITDCALVGLSPVEKGKLGNSLSATFAEIRGVTIKGFEVSFRLPNGQISRIDLFGIDQDGTFQFIESKFGLFARLTENQKLLRKTLKNRGTVIPVGENARAAGLQVGVPIGGMFQLDRFFVRLDDFL